VDGSEPIPREAFREDVVARVRPPAGASPMDPKR
jgi:hypothetical protein